jgi:hypothetical protein
MLVQPIFGHLDITPGPSSQTTSTWPFIQVEGDQHIMSQGVGHDIGSPTILASREQIIDDLIEHVMADYAGAWERLAAL